MYLCIEFTFELVSTYVNQFFYSSEDTGTVDAKSLSEAFDVEILTVTLGGVIR